MTTEPTGLLIDAAMELVTSFVKEVSVDERREALVRASKYALTRGVTTVVDLGRYYPGTTDELSWIDFEGALHCQYSYLHAALVLSKLITFFMVQMSIYGLTQRRR